MTTQPGSLRYNLPTNDFSVNPTGTEDGWVPLYLSPSAESLTKEDLDTWAEKLGGQNQSRLYVDNGTALASDSRNNRGNSKLRPFKTIERALIEAARISFRKNPLGIDQQNDIYERISISVAPGEYEILNGPRAGLNLFENYTEHQQASYLISLNRESVVEKAYTQLDAQYQSVLIKQDLEYLLNSITEDLSTGGNFFVLKFARALITKDENIVVIDPNNPPAEYFVTNYADGAFRAALIQVLYETYSQELIKAIQNQGDITDFEVSIPPGDVLVDVIESINTLVNLLINVLICDIDPRDPNVEDPQDYNLTDFPDREPTKADLQRFNSIVRPGVILPRGVSIVGEDLRKVVIRPTYVPDPQDPEAGRGAIFRMTGGNFFSGFTVKDRKVEDFANTSHHKLSVFEFCTNADLDLYYNQVNNAFSDGSIYERALVTSRLIESNEDWIEQNSITAALSFNSLTFSKIYEGEVHSFLVSIEKDLKSLSNKNSVEWGSRFYVDHILTIEDSNLRSSAIDFYTTQINTTYSFIVRAIVNSGDSTDLENVDARSEEFIFPAVDGNTFSGRNADVQAAIFTYAEIAKSLISGVEPTQTEFANPFTSTDIEVINQETSIVLGVDGLIEDENYPEDKINTVKGGSPYIFSASLRSEYGMCGIDGDGSNVTGLRSYLAAQFTIISLQKDPNAFVEDLSVVGNKRYKGTLSTDGQDWRHFGYRVDNEAYSQLVSCFCIGPAIHYIAEGGAEFSITNSTSNFGDVSLFSRGFVDNGTGGGSYPQDQGHKLLGIKKPAPISDVPRRFAIGYLKNNGTTLDSGSDPQTGTITLSGDLRDYGYDLIGSIIKVDVSDSITSRAEIISISTDENLITTIEVKYLTNYESTWNADQSSPGFVFGIVGKPLYIKRFVDVRSDEDKFYKLIISKSGNLEVRKPVLNYILRKNGVNSKEEQPFKAFYDERIGFEIGDLFYLLEITELETTYECLISSAYSNKEGAIRYYDELLESAGLGDAGSIDPEDFIGTDLNDFAAETNFLNKKEIRRFLELLGIDSSVITNQDLNLGLNRTILLEEPYQVLLDFNKPSIIRCSGHTWEYQGYLNYSSSLPKLQTKNIGFGLDDDNTSRVKLLKTQTEKVSGRIYATGMDEEGNYYVGNKILDLKSGSEKLVGRSDTPAFDPQIISTFENLNVRNNLNTQFLEVNDNSLVINADATGIGNDNKLIISRNYFNQEDDIELFFPPNTGEDGQVLTTDGLGILSWKSPTPSVIISNEAPNSRPDGTSIQSGDLWFDNITANLFIYYEDPDSGQWVQLTENRNIGLWPGINPIFPDGIYIESSPFWNNAPTNLYCEGCIEISIDGINFSQGPLTINVGDILYTRWIERSDCAGSNHNTTISGSISDGFYIASGQLTLDRSVISTEFKELKDQALSSVSTSLSTRIRGFNAPVKIWSPIGTSTNREISINGGSWISLPHGFMNSLSIPYLEPEGTPIKIRHTNSNNLSTTVSTFFRIGYSDTEVGSTNFVWYTTTVGPDPSISEPIILTPINGATNLGEQPIFTASEYISQNSAGNHAVSDWEIGLGSDFSNIVYQSFDDPNNKTSIEIPENVLLESSSYIIRVRYGDGIIKSSWSPGSKFSTGLFEPDVDILSLSSPLIQANNKHYSTRPNVSYGGSLRLESAGSSDFLLYTTSGTNQLIVKNSEELTYFSEDLERVENYDISENRVKLQYVGGYHYLLWRGRVVKTINGITYEYVGGNAESIDPYEKTQNLQPGQVDLFARAGLPLYSNNLIKVYDFYIPLDNSKIIIAAETQEGGGDIYNRTRLFVSEDNGITYTTDLYHKYQQDGVTTRPPIYYVQGQLFNRSWTNEPLPFTTTLGEDLYVKASNSYLTSDNLLLSNDAVNWWDSGIFCGKITTPILLSQNWYIFAANQPHLSPAPTSQYNCSLFVINRTGDRWYSYPITPPSSQSPIQKDFFFIKDERTVNLGLFDDFYRLEVRVV